MNRTTEPSWGKQNQPRQTLPRTPVEGDLRHLLSRAEVARLLGVCPHTVQRLSRRGQLPCRTFNRRLIRYHPDDVDAFLRNAMTSSPEVGND